MGYVVLKDKDKKQPSIVQSINSDIIPIQEKSDTAQTIKELNDDSMNVDKFSAIDMKSRLLDSEISSIIALDVLVSFKFLPQEAGYITRSKKRLSVSRNGLGRSEIVEISKGMSEQTKNTSLWDKMGSWLRGGN